MPCALADMPASWRALRSQTSGRMPKLSAENLRREGRDHPVQSIAVMRDAVDVAIRSHHHGAAALPRQPIGEQPPVLRQDQDAIADAVAVRGVTRADDHALAADPPPQIE